MADAKDARSRFGSRSTLVITLIIIVLLPLGYAIVRGMIVPSPPPAHVFLEMPAPEHKACIRDTEFMRFHHWELLRGVREQVVRYGIRDAKGLKDCSTCHTSRERFCDRCHSMASVSPDCFGCHNYP